MKAPYTFPHKSRAAMAGYLTDRTTRSYHFVTYQFCWNVKVTEFEFDSATLRTQNQDLDPRWDARWEAHVADNENLFWQFCEDAAREVAEGEWTSYPGEDQGDWEFLFEGRSGGWLCLRKWRGRDVRQLHFDDLVDRDLWDFTDLRAFYRGIRTADSDFTSAKATAEVTYQAAFRRECLEDEWEAERRQALADYEAEMYEARPDLAPAA